MHRLRTTFKRSRTPTGAEMKTQSSLEVPKQIRSASFDEIQLEAKRNQQRQQGGSGGGTENSSLLKVPQYVNQRSKSVDSGASGSDESSNYLEVPRRFPRRRSSGSKTPICFHCLCVEEYAKMKTDASNKSIVNFSDEQIDRDSEDSFRGRSCSMTDEDFSSSENDDESNDSPATIGSPEPIPMPPIPCSITVTLSTTVEPPQSPPPFQLPPLNIEPLSSTTGDDVTIPTTPTRRRSIQRQEAFFGEPTGNSLENMSDTASDVPSECTSEGTYSEGDAYGTAISVATNQLISGFIVRDIYLTVPDLKRDRAASVDSCFSKVSSQGKTEELQHSGVSLEVPVGPNVALRSRSVDIVLPTNEQARYKALAMASTTTTVSQAVTVAGATANISANVTTVNYVRGRAVGDAGVGGDAISRGIRCTPDWSENAVNGDHLWVPTSVSGDFCYVGDADCTKHGSRMKCSACNVVVHLNCINVLMDRIKFTCKPTFRDVGVRQYREQTTIQHHWVHRRSEKGKCKQCGKSFQSKLSFSSKEIVAISCSWCKSAYHNKETCFNIQRIGEQCDLGVQNSIIVPPSWIVKLPRHGSFKSSLRKSPKKKSSNKKRNKEKDPKDQKTFVIKPIPSAVTPVIVFINPKSGGNQGLKLLQKFQWLLNPRQVFDLTQGGPKMGLELFRKAPNLRILACGGDGTVGWVLSILDQITIVPQPAVGVLPLGTGNDLARALGWGGGYTDEPISKILANIGKSDTVLLDRWQVEVEKNPNAEPNEDGKDNLPLNVVNNYFSLGVDAHIALEFHEAREAHPEKFNSRLRNKMFYGQAGGKDLLKRKWKGLAEFVKLECDGKDLTPKLKEHKVHAIVFLNIPSYGGGTHPWNRSGGNFEPATDDGLIEVVGLTTYQLPLLQAGGHGTCITQCKSANIITSKTIPMQVDGEACKLKPSIIKMSLLNKALMLAKRRGPKSNTPQATLGQLKITLQRINMTDYEQHHYDKELLSQAATNIGSMEINPASDLEQVRAQINKLISENADLPKLNPDWCFVDSCTAERFFRVDRAQENLHYVTDIAADALFILDTGNSAGGSEDETALPSPSSNKQYSIPEMRISSDGSLDSSSDKQHSTDSVGSLPNLVDAKGDSIDISKSESESDINNRLTDDNTVPLSPKQSTTSNLALNGKKENNFDQTEEDKSQVGGIKSNLLEKTTDGILKAAKLGDLKTLKELHSQGYSLLSIDSNGQTALHYGARYGHKDIVKYLIASAPTTILNMADNDKGQTALHKAAAYKRRSICCMLVAGGASLTIEDHRGNTPRMLALAAEDNELAAYLESQEHFQLVSEDLETVV